MLALNQNRKLKAWLKINHVQDSQRSLKGQLVMHQILFFDLHYLSRFQVVQVNSVERYVFF